MRLAHEGMAWVHAILFWGGFERWGAPRIPHTLLPRPPPSDRMPTMNPSFQDLYFAAADPEEMRSRCAPGPAGRLGGGRGARAGAGPAAGRGRRERHPRAADRAPRHALSGGFGGHGGQPQRAHPALDRAPAAAGHARRSGPCRADRRRRTNRRGRGPGGLVHPGRVRPARVRPRRARAAQVH